MHEVLAAALPCPVPRVNRVLPLLICSVRFIRCGDTSVQRNCIFPGRYAPLTYYEDSRNMFMARNAREMCNFFAHLYLHNG